ncbi:peptide-methionine (R)-S-oxide reductase MsrB [Hydromonas duriensis]|uniref:peptide-methionine (R)-S-oxide reductase n=1 Tax=Hydromonas duriensis TaxID=1527608 RepID=A0A4R6YBT4_9BURK|nr:peptide-methionine (R)-S-oxide reductase MsrB [Hydromonas duriensis]TDR33115.1 peptide-methionine (R)-S-oxide reductase [Hydromonas duriensis]
MSQDKTNLRERLGALAYQVTQEKATERPFSSDFAERWSDGVYRCVVCDTALFDSHHQFNAGCGWPSFDAPMAVDAVSEQRDVSHGMIRTEVVCHNCGAHLGHVFPDGPPQTTGLRYCINGVALKFLANKDMGD